MFVFLNCNIPGSYHYIRVPLGKLAKVWIEQQDKDGFRVMQPRLLHEGEHCVDSFVFKFDGFIDVCNEYIQHGSIHRIAVEKGVVAKVWHDNMPRLLGEGVHTIESTYFTFSGTEAIVDITCMSHGTITILRVPVGQVALVWDNKEPKILDQPGLYEFDSPDFSLVEFRDADEQVITLGAKKIIVVNTGQVAVTYDQGHLKVLTSGRHVIDSATHIFDHFLSTKERTFYLSSCSKESADHLTVCETKDLVKVALRAMVYYRVDNPEKCVSIIDTDGLGNLVRETAVTALTNLIASTTLEQIAQSKTILAGKDNATVSVPQSSSKEDSESGSSSSVVFFERVQEKCLQKLQYDFLQKYGVDISNILVESCKLMDEDLAEEMSKQALNAEQFKNERERQEGQALLSLAQERTAAEIMVCCYKKRIRQSRRY
jgi:regulator of protease activity HflC (stomatin/prohibitin superfamily)